MSERVGFIGLGIMGEGMAKNLLKAGRTLAVWNRSSAKAEALKADSPEGSVLVCDTPAAVLAECTLVYAMLSTPAVVKEVYEMDNGMLAGVKQGTAIVDCATLAAEDMQRLSEQVTSRGGRFLEAPVSGSKGPAAAGQLIFLCGGDKSLFDEIQTDLEAMGKAHFFFGDIGAGARMKLVVNMTMGSMLCALGEGLALAEASDLDPQQLLQVIELGVMANPMFKLKGPKMLKGEFEPNFPLQHAQKDMRLATELGSAKGLPLPVASASNESMKKACDAGAAELDFAAVYKTQKKP